MAEKKRPVGICDHCGGPISPGDWYTSKRRPRLHCSFECKQAANAIAGGPTVSRKNRERMARGQWRNPADIRKPDPANIGRGASIVRRREVAEGRWRNPALTDASRAKLSRPRKHTGPLHAALEKLKRGLRTADLTDEEREAHRDYRRRLRDSRKPEVNSRRRTYNRRRQENLTDEGREAQRARWREENRRRSKPEP